MKTYCLGFIRSVRGDELLLIEKQRPAYQAGMFNGIGGKCEPGEDGLAAMIRECEEECGLRLPAHAWRAMGTWGDGEHYSIALFEARSDLDAALSCTDEPVHRVPYPIPSTVPLAPDVATMLTRLTA